MQPKHLDIESIRVLPSEWIVQLRRQIYEQRYLVDVQGFRLTPEERRNLVERNNRFEKPMVGETEILDHLDFNAPVEKWKWYKVSSVIYWTDIKFTNSVQIGKVLAKIARNNDNVKCKNIHNIKYYYLPLTTSNIPLTELNK